MEAQSGNVVFKCVLFLSCQLNVPASQPGKELSEKKTGKALSFADGGVSERETNGNKSCCHALSERVLWGDIQASCDPDNTAFRVH